MKQGGRRNAAGEYGVGNKSDLNTDLEVITSVF